jgi:phage replication O-like protein O
MKNIGRLPMGRPKHQDAEHSFTNVPAQLTAQVSRTNFSAYETRVFWLIVRNTFGWQKPTDLISFTQFQEATGMERVHIGRTLKRLINRNIIVCAGGTSTGHTLEYGVQTDYSLWQGVLPEQVTKIEKKASNYQPRLLPEEVTVEDDELLRVEVTNGTEKTEKTVTSKRAERYLKTRVVLPKEVTKVLPKEVNTNQELILQTNITKEEGVKKTFLEYKENLRKRFSDLSFDEEFEKYALYYEGVKQKKPKLALFNWMTKARRIMLEEKSGRFKANRGFSPGKRRDTTNEERRAGLVGVQHPDLSDV